MDSEVYPRKSTIYLFISWIMNESPPLHGDARWLFHSSLLLKLKKCSSKPLQVFCILVQDLGNGGTKENIAAKRNPPQINR
jgi:hypothetical protein